MATRSFLGTFTAPADGQPTGVLVQLTCYTAEATGELAARHEIAEYTWLTYADRDRVSPADQLVFDPSMPWVSCRFDAVRL